MHLNLIATPLVTRWLSDDIAILHKGPNIENSADHKPHNGGTQEITYGWLLHNSAGLLTNKYTPLEEVSKSSTIVNHVTVSPLLVNMSGDNHHVLLT